MKFVGRWLGICVVALSGVSALAADRELSFLRMLQDNGYGDVAVDYLKILDKRPDLPAATRDIWDLEMSRSLRAASRNAYNAEEAETLTAESQKFLDKFLKDKPTHPQAVSAMADSATFTKARGLKLLRSAETTSDATKKAQFLAEARPIFDETKVKLKEAHEKFKAELAKLPQPPRRPTGAKEKEAAAAYYDLLQNAIVARYEYALIGYYISQTYTDPKDETRKKILQEASKALDDIFQEDRNSDIGLFAHMWQGKVMEEMGDLDTALEIYEEVVVNQDPANGNRQMQSLLAIVERYRLGILAKTKPKEYPSEADGWLKDKINIKYLKTTEGYGGVALDLVKFALAAAEKASDNEKKKFLSAAWALVADMAKTVGPYQPDFIRMLRDRKGSDGEGPKTSVAAGSFDEAVTFGNLALQENNFEEAEKQYAKALEFFEKATRKPKELVEKKDKVRESLAATIYARALAAFRKGNPAECMTLATRVIDEFETTLAAPQAGALKVQTQLYIYVSTDAKKKDEKAAALAKLETFAAETIEKWPANPVADDARIALGQASLAKDDLDKAIETFATCNAKSDRYASALQYSGQTLWRRHLLERQKPEAEQNKDRMKSDVAEAAAKLAESIALQNKKLEAGKPLPKALVDTQLALAEIYNDGNEPAKAAELLQPLVDVVKAVKKGDDIDPSTLRIAVGSVRAFLASNQLDKATEIGLVLAEVGPDKPPINNVLLEFAKQLNAARKQADADLIQAGGDAGKLAAAQAKLKSVKDALAQLLPKLAERKEVSVNNMVLVGDILTNAELNDLARQQYENILKDQGANPKAAKAMTRVRVQLVGLLKKKGDYQAAITQMDELIKQQPNALDALMERGRILQSWADKDASKWIEASKHWNMLFERLKNMKFTPKAGEPSKPIEFYEVTYNLAFCLAYDATKISKTDKDMAQKKFKGAQQALKATLFADPKLTGPDMVAKYKALIDKLGVALGQTPAAGK